MDFTPSGFTRRVFSRTNVTIDGLTNGASYTFTTKAQNGFGYGPGASVSKTLPPPKAGYWMLGADGAVYAFGSSKNLGRASYPSWPSGVSAVAIKSRSDGTGYWIVDSAGGVHAFGNAHFYGSTGGMTHPLAGIGSRGFAAAYLRERRSLENPARAHSLELDALSETGILGFALLAVGIGCPLAIAARRARRSLLDASLLGACVYWLVHASVDWIWSIPANGLPFFLLLGIGAAGGGVPRLLRARAALPAGAAAVVLAALAFAPPWLSARFDDRAYTEASPAKILGDLPWARRLDPLSTEPYLTQAELSRSPADVAPLERAVAKEPRVADLRFRLGSAYLRAGRKADARRELAAAHRLAPNYAPYVEALRRAG